MTLLDRYVLRQFIEPFLLCFGGFLAIWLVFDLTDNAPDFLDASASFKQIGAFYLTQLPYIIMLSLPIALLLALLYCLSRMSRSNELISMLTAGRSLPRVLAPLIICGLMATGGTLWLNWELGPHAEGAKEIALEQIKRGQKRAASKQSIETHLFPDRQHSRKWFVRRIKPNQPNFLEGVHVIQQDAAGRVVKKWYADGANYNQRQGGWTLVNGLIVELDEKGDVAKFDSFETGYRSITSEAWPETPWRIASSEAQPQDLSVPELREYLHYNADFPPAQLAPYASYFHHRLAQPWSCLVAVLIAGGLGVVFSRRGVVKSVGLAIFSFGALIPVTYLCLALGKGAHLSPIVAAWAPNAVFALFGLVLLWTRASNRELPKIIGG